MEQKHIRRPQKRLIRVPRQKRKRSTETRYALDTRTPKGIHLPY
ncbi:hypothetical protein [Streptosporangium sp. NPDC002524]